MKAGSHHAASHFSSLSERSEQRYRSGPSQSHLQELPRTFLEWDRKRSELCRGGTATRRTIRSADGKPHHTFRISRGLPLLSIRVGHRLWSAHRVRQARKKTQKVTRRSSSARFSSSKNANICGKTRSGAVLKCGRSGVSLPRQWCDVPGKKTNSAVE